MDLIYKNHLARDKGPLGGKEIGRKNKETNDKLK